MNIKDIQKKVKQFVERNDLEAGPEIRTLDIVSELGEVSKEIIRMTDYGRKKPEFREELEKEIGDLLFSVVCLANIFGINLEEAVMKILDKYNERIHRKQNPSSD